MKSPGWERFSLNLVYACARWTMTKCALEPRDGFRVAFRERFHATIREIPHVTGNSFQARSIFGEVSEADPLYSTSDEIAARDDHTGGSYRQSYRYALTQGHERDLEGTAFF